MNKKILKNPLRQHLKTIFRGREVIFKSKNSKVFDFDDEEQKAEYAHWINIYPMIYDITVLMGGDINEDDNAA